MPLSLGKAAFLTYCKVRSITEIQGKRVGHYYDANYDIKMAWDAVAETIQKMVSTNK